MMESVSKALRNQESVRALLSNALIFHTKPTTMHAAPQETGSARFAGQLKTTMKTTVSRIGIAAIKAYIKNPPNMNEFYNGIQSEIHCFL